MAVDVCVHDDAEICRCLTCNNYGSGDIGRADFDFYDYALSNSFLHHDLHNYVMGTCCNAIMPPIPVPVACSQNVSGRRTVSPRYRYVPGFHSPPPPPSLTRTHLHTDNATSRCRCSLTACWLCAPLWSAQSLSTRKSCWRTVTHLFASGSALYFGVA